MKNALILAYDLGTTSLKTTLLDPQGRLVASETQFYKTFHDGERVEQEPKDWWNCVCQTTSRLFSEHPEYANQVDAIGVCGHMLGCLPVDGRGEPLVRCMTHADARAGRQMETISRSIGASKLYHKTGCVLNPQNSLCKTLWLRENEPEIYNKTARFLQSKDYLAFRLTGNLDTTDYSDASHGMLFDIINRKYLDSEMRELGLDVNKFPAVHRGTEVIGKLTQEAANQLGLNTGIPVVAGGGDGACATAGAGISRQGDVYCSLGTTAWITYLSAQAVIDERERIFDIMMLDGEGIGVFGTMQTAGRAFEWAQELFGLETPEKMNRIAAEAPAGSKDLVFLPYLEGERSPIFDSSARGMYFNISTEHEQKHFVRAVMEGTAYALRSILEVYRESQDVKRMRVIGGGAKSPLWLQIIADVCDVELETLGDSASSQTSLGAAFAAGVGVGIYRNLDEAIRSIETDKIIRPNQGNRDVYDSGFDRYMRLYPSVKGLYKKGGV